jgi:hypothetical protein
MIIIMSVEQRESGLVVFLLIVEQKQCGVVIYAVFPACYNNVNYGFWCPDCSESRTEKLVRAYFEKKFHKPFPNTRPSWLLNHTGNKLELDGYSEQLNIAFEYNGEQHYRFSQRWHITIDVFDDQLYRDFIKYTLCDIFEIKVCVIPYTLDCYNEEELYNFIDDWIRENC